MGSPNANNTNGQFPRLSDRFGVDDLVVTWIVPNNRKILGKKTAKIDMAVIDLSIAGALVIGPVIDSVRQGARVPFIHEGQQGLAEVRHVRIADDLPGAKAAYYGIVFLNLTDELKALIFESMAQRRARKSSDLNEIWNQAR